MEQERNKQRTVKICFIFEILWQSLATCVGISDLFSEKLHCQFEGNMKREVINLKNQKHIVFGRPLTMKRNFKKNMALILNDEC